MDEHQINNMAEAICKEIWEKAAPPIGFGSDDKVRIAKAVITALKEMWKDSVALVWGIEDVHTAANRMDKAITDEDARNVLETCRDRHDAEQGVNWDVIEDAIEGYDTRDLTDEEQDRVTDGETIAWKRDRNDHELEPQMPEKPCADGSIAVEGGQS